MITIDEQHCKGCGICGHVCPRHIPETTKNGSEKVTIISKERIDLCMECGHCEAVCPNSAISLDAFRTEQSHPLEELNINESQYLTLVRQRRSIRRYKDKAVPRSSLNRIIESIHASPTGTGRRSTGVIVLDKPEVLERFSEILYGVYEDLEKGLKNPIARFIIKKRVGPQVFNTLNSFVMPGMHWYIRWYREGKSNEILRDCPALILLHSPVQEPMGAENCLIAALHGIFMSQILGIGSCFNDLIPPACNRAPKIRKMLDLPDDRNIHASITLGYSKYNFKRTIPRELAEVRYVE